MYIDPNGSDLKKFWTIVFRGTVIFALLDVLYTAHLVKLILDFNKRVEPFNNIIVKLSPSYSDIIMTGLIALIIDITIIVSVNKAPRFGKVKNMLMLFCIIIIINGIFPYGVSSLNEMNHGYITDSSIIFSESNFKPLKKYSFNKIKNVEVSLAVSRVGNYYIEYEINLVDGVYIEITSFNDVNDKKLLEIDNIFKTNNVKIERMLPDSAALKEIKKEYKGSSEEIVFNKLLNLDM